MTELLLVIIFLLAVLAVCVMVMAGLLFRYVKIFNNIHENTLELSKDLRKLNYALTEPEKNELLKAFD